MTESSRAQNQNQIPIEEEAAGLRLDRWFSSRYPELAFGRLQKLLRTGQIRLDGKRVTTATRLVPGQILRLPPNFAASLQKEGVPGTKAASRPLPEREVKALQKLVLYKDDWVLALNKPAGLAVQGGSGQTRHLDAMLDGLRFHADTRPRLVHRLDRDTSGLLLLARNRTAAQGLTASFKGSEARKLYWALVAGRPAKTTGRIDLALEKQKTAGGEKVVADPLGKPATSLYSVVTTYRNQVSLVVLRPLSGRTHQLRVHMAALGCPILGDGKYGGKKAFPEVAGLSELPKVLYLHAYSLALPHPEDETTLRVTAPLPAVWLEALQALGFTGIEPEAIKAGDALEDTR